MTDRQRNTMVKAKKDCGFNYLLSHETVSKGSEEKKHIETFKCLTHTHELHLKLAFVQSTRKYCCGAGKSLPRIAKSCEGLLPLGVLLIGRSRYLPPCTELGQLQRHSPSGAIGNRCDSSERIDCDDAVRPKQATFGILSIQALSKENYINTGHSAVTPTADADRHNRVAWQFSCTLRCFDIRSPALFVIHLRFIPTIIRLSWPVFLARYPS
jgi:hypothetical protein